MMTPPIESGEKRSTDETNVGAECRGVDLDLKFKLTI
jgi:hypothetical protein